MCAQIIHQGLVCTVHNGELKTGTSYRKLLVSCLLCLLQQRLSWDLPRTSRIPRLLIYSCVQRCRIILALTNMKPRLKTSQSFWIDTIQELLDYKITNSNRLCWSFTLVILCVNKKYFNLWIFNSFYFK